MNNDLAVDYDIEASGKAYCNLPLKLNPGTVMV